MKGETGLNIKEYAAQQAPQAQEPQQAQEALTVAQLADRMQAEKLSSLMDSTTAAIEVETPPADLLRIITAALYGASSTQAAAVAQLIEQDKRPGGYEHQLAGMRERKRLLKKQLKQLEELTKATADAIAQIEQEERSITLDGSRAAAIDAALLEVMAFSKRTLIEPQADLLEDAAQLYQQYKGNPAAMGLLHGCLVDLTRRAYTAGAFDLVQMQEYQKLKEQVAAAVES